MIAKLTQKRLEKAGLVVVGPVSSVEQALSLIRSEPQVDLSFVDWNLNGETAQPVIDMLSDSKIPFCVATGNANMETSEAFENVLEKPFSAERFSEVLSVLLLTAKKDYSARNLENGSDAQRLETADQTPQA